MRPRASLWAAAAVVWAALPLLGGAGAAPAGGGQRALPDLRIVRLTAEPVPFRDERSLRLTLRLHNDSGAVAAGRIAVQVSHDRGTPQPLPPFRELIYMAPDALEEVVFEVPAPELAFSPYTFFAMVDVLDDIREADESNNTAWERVAGCGDPRYEEVADGFDNDCDGLVDAGLGLTVDPAEALRLLHAAQRRAERDAVALAYAAPRLFAPFALERPARLAARDGQLVGYAGDTPAALEATSAEPGPRNELVLVDWNGEDVAHGDLVSFRNRDGAFVVAAGGGGGGVAIRETYRERERLFRVIRNEDGTISLATSTGAFVNAVDGGGGEVRADQPEPVSWEMFTLLLE